MAYDDQTFAKVAHEYREQRDRRCAVIPIPAPRQGDADDRVRQLEAALRPIHEVEAALSSRYLVKGWLDRGAASVLYGESNVGKTFLALDMALNVAASRSWQGHRVATTYGPVIYVAGEGGFGFRNRIEALRLDQPDLVEAADLLLLPTTLDLPLDVDVLISVFGRLPDMPCLIVIDTLARAMGAGDENSAQDMGRFIAAVDRLRAATGAHVMLVHHTGKDTSKGARGSSALRAAVDTEIELTREGDVITAETRKQRDMRSGASFIGSNTMSAFS